AIPKRGAARPGDTALQAHSETPDECALNTDNAAPQGGLLQLASDGVSRLAVETAYWVRRGQPALGVGATQRYAAQEWPTPMRWLRSAQSNSSWPLTSTLRSSRLMGLLWTDSWCRVLLMVRRYAWSLPRTGPVVFPLGACGCCLNIPEVNDTACGLASGPRYCSN